MQTHSDHKYTGMHVTLLRLLLVYFWMLQWHPRHLFQLVLGHLCVYSWLISHAIRVSFRHS